MDGGRRSESIGEKRIFGGIVEPARWARTNGPPHLVPPLARRSERGGGRDLGGDFSEKVRERNDTDGKEDVAS